MMMVVVGVESVDGNIIRHACVVPFVIFLIVDYSDSTVEFAGFFFNKEYTE